MAANPTSKGQRRQFGALSQASVRGLFAYYAVLTNGAAPRAFRSHVERIWLRTPRRCSQKDGLSWLRMQNLAADRVSQRGARLSDGGIGAEASPI